MNSRTPLRVINSVAPIRIVDNGGWTDTWFAGHGKIFNIGIYPYAEVQVEVFPADGERERVIIQAENYGDRYAMTPEQRYVGQASAAGGRHSLYEDPREPGPAGHDLLGSSCRCFDRDFGSGIRGIARGAGPVDTRADDPS